MDSWLMPLQDQANIVREKVIQNMDNLYCVKNFISLGGPHAGTASVPLCGRGIICIIIDNLIKLEIYSNYVQEISNYLEGCRFLPKLNNELPAQRNSTYKERFSSLENLVLIMFEHDTVLIPRDTAWFGYYPDGAFKPILSPQEVTTMIVLILEMVIMRMMMIVCLLKKNLITPIGPQPILEIMTMMKINVDE